MLAEANAQDVHLTTAQQFAICADGPDRRSVSECWSTEEEGRRRHVDSEDTYISLYSHQGVWWVNWVDGGTNTWDRYGTYSNASDAYQTAVSDFGPHGHLDEDGKPVWTTTDVEDIPDADNPAAGRSWTKGMAGNHTPAAGLAAKPAVDWTEGMAGTSTPTTRTEPARKAATGSSWVEGMRHR